MDVFWSLWQHARAFTPERGRFTTRLRAMVRHRAIDALGRRRAQPPSLPEPPEEEAELEAPDPSVEDAAEARELAQAIQRALAVLPPAQRQALERAYSQG